jgi:hypothetical protein
MELKVQQVHKVL